MEYTFTTWEEYWGLFDKLIELLNKDNQITIAKSFKESQAFVNGLTDGWYEFKFAFQKTFETNRSRMKKEQLDLAESLMIGLNRILRS